MLRTLPYVLLLITLVPIAASAQAPAPDPILFVHGWRGSAAQWNTMAARFREDGWRDEHLFAWTLDSRESNVATAARIAARVDQILVATGAGRVDIVTHSMGALSARYYLKSLRSAGKVDAWVSLGGPNHGIVAAELCFSGACRDMRRGSPFLAALNQGDETPGTARYATWRSPCDELVAPPATVILDGAVNHETGCISHLELLRDTAVYREVREHVSAEPIPELHEMGRSERKPTTDSERWSTDWGARPPQSGHFCPIRNAGDRPRHVAFGAPTAADHVRLQPRIWRFRWHRGRSM